MITKVLIRVYRICEVLIFSQIGLLRTGNNEQIPL